MSCIVARRRGPAARVDWRRSARDDRAFVREREWEAAQTLWIWIDRSASMRFGSALAEGSKLDRAIVLALALADVAVRGGERVGLLGLSRPIAHRSVIDRFAEILLAAERSGAPMAAALPAQAPLAARAKLALIGDFLSPEADIAVVLRLRASFPRSLPSATPLPHASRMSSAS